MKNYKNVTEFLPCKNTTSVAQVLFVKLVSYFLPDIISSCEVNGGVIGWFKKVTQAFNSSKLTMAGQKKMCLVILVVLYYYDSFMQEYMSLILIWCWWRSAFEILLHMSHPVLKTYLIAILCTRIHDPF